MNFSLYIAKRYLFSPSKNNAINIITGIASFGIVVGAMALFIVLSVFSGLKIFNLSFSNSFDPDLKITALTGKTITISDSQNHQLNGLDNVLANSKIIEERVLFLFKNKEEVASIKGIDSLYNTVNNVKKDLFNGQWLEPQTNQCVVGFGVSDKLSLGLFDFNNIFQVFVPKPGKGNIENPADAFLQETIIPVGIYSINEDLDNKYVFTDLALAQQILQLKPNQVSAIELKLNENANQDKIRSEILKIFKNKVLIKNRAQLNESLYKMLNTENFAVYLIFTLVIILTLFTLAGSIIMIILDKKSNIKTMFNLGVNLKELKKIFLIQGTLLTFFGGIIGLFLGSVIVLIQQFFQVIMITPTLAYPVDFNFQNIIIVFITIFSLGFIASYISSRWVQKGLL